MGASMLHAADPCPECQTEMVIDDQTGGLVTAVPPHKLGKSYSPYLNNVIIDDNQIEQIKGYETVGSTRVLQRVDGIYPYYLENGQTQFLVTDSSVVLETTDFQSYVFVSSGLNSGAKLRCKQINNDMVCTNGVDSVFKWNHTSKTILDGTNGTPNVPKGKFIEYYQERVWMFNLPSDASGVRFSDVSSTNGVIIAYDNFLAWPADNLVHVGQGDGQIGTAIWLENGALKLGKERSIYTMTGNGLPGSRYIARISNPGVGVASNDSVVILDNQSHFVGHDGIYRNEQRISDLIENESNLIDRGSVKTISNLWETKEDFLRGQFSNSTVTIEGLVTTLGGDSQVMYSDLDPLTANMGLLTDGSPTIGFSVFTPTATVNPNGIYNLRLWHINLAPTGCSSLPRVQWTIKNNTTNEITSFTYTSNSLNSRDSKDIFIFPNLGGADQSQTQQFNSSNTYSGTDINNGNISIKAILENVSGCSSLYVSFTNPAGGNMYFTAKTTGQYISDVATMNTVSAWGNFDSEQNTNGGNISYYYRTSTSVVNIATQTWQTTASGTRIGAPIINRFIQWASTLQTVNILSPSNIDNVEIVHVEGSGAINRAFAIPWRNRYWLSYSSSSDQVSSAMLLKSKITNKNPDAWMPISGINIRSFAKDKEDTLYGGASSTGIVYILDTGNNFNGSPIVSEYETPSIFFDSLFKEKYLYDHFVSAERYPNSSYSIGVAIDTQAYVSSSYGLTGNGLQNRVVQNIRGHGKLFKWKITHSAYDEPFVFHNLGVLYRPSMIRKGRDD